MKNKESWFRGIHPPAPLPLHQDEKEILKFFKTNDYRRKEKECIS